MQEPVDVVEMRCYAMQCDDIRTAFREEEKNDGQEGKKEVRCLSKRCWVDVVLE
jgi:hypothetical protein